MIISIYIENHCITGYMLILQYAKTLRNSISLSRDNFIFSSTLLFLSCSVMSNSVTPRTAACQNSLSFTVPWSLLKLMSIDLEMPSNHLILCIPLSSCLQSFPALGSFSNAKSQLFASGGQCIGASALSSVLPMNIQG